MSIMDLAVTPRVSGGYATFSALDAYPQFYDAPTDRTRVIVTRDSDGAMYALEAPGAPTFSAPLVDVHNERSRISHERSAAAKLAEDDSTSPEDRESLLAEVAALDKALKDMLRTRAFTVTPVARTLAHYAE